MKKNILTHQLNKSLKNLKFKSTDNVYIGINLGNVFKKQRKTLFKKKNNINKIRENCAKIIFKTLTKYFSNGNIIVPTFYYEYFKKKKFNKYKTGSSLGFFENYVIKQKNVLRSNHPVFSIAVYGKHKKKITQPSGPFSFGVNSPFNNFLRYKVIFLNLGVKFKDTCTFLHHVEHMNGINHRYYKAINGKIFENKKYIDKTSFSLVRFKSIKSKKAEYKIEKLLKNNRYLKEFNKYGFYVSKVKSTDVYKCSINKLIEDPSYFMSKKTIVKLEK